MKRIAITGGIGSGKSVVARRLGELGARVFDADGEARRIMEADADVRAGIIAALGAEAYTEDGSLNKPFVARRIFGRAELRNAVNAVVHPVVYRAFEAFCDDAEREGAPLAGIESAVLFDLGETPSLDAIVVVESSREDRIQRVVDRDGQSEEAVLQRMAGQLPHGSFAEKADYLLANYGTVQDLEQAVDTLFALITDPSPNHD